MIDLSIIIATCNRPAALATCLQQVRQQAYAGFTVEVIVVDESVGDDNRVTTQQFGVSKYYQKKTEGLCGAYAKDFGLQWAAGTYVCFWDDDNVYYQHAMTTLFGAAYDYDIGVVQTWHRQRQPPFAYRPIPVKWQGAFEFRQIDTMCVCVRTELAQRELWSAHQQRGTDYAWLTKLAAYNPRIRYLPIIIGVHL